LRTRVKSLATTDDPFPAGISEHLSQLSSSSNANRRFSSPLMEDQDISPSAEAARPLLLQTEDQLGSVNETDVDSAFIDEDSVSFIPLSPSVNPDDYLFTLDDSEGISELFDINAASLSAAEPMARRIS